MQSYLVGGAVRDELLGLPVKERDWVVVGATPQRMLELGYRQVGKDFPVFLHPETQEEYALARTERKTAPGYHGFQVQAAPDVSLEQDLRRRDLTINAMARDAQDQLIDPFGGLDDLRRRLLRHVSPAFAEDPVRILRSARFAARYAGLGFHLAEETLELMRGMVTAGEANHLVPERVWQELVKALAEPRPSPFFEVLRQCGALGVILPEIDRLFGVPQPPQHHPEIDTGRHSLLVLDQCAQLTDDPRTRFAALCHDLGKGLTFPEFLPSHHGHEERGEDLVEGLCARLKAPVDYRDLARLTARLHGRIHKLAELRPRTVLDILEQADALRRPDRFGQLLRACEADYRGRMGFEDRPYPQRGLFQNALAATQGVNGSELIGPGMSGEQIRQAIHQARLHAIRQVLGQG